MGIIAVYAWLQSRLGCTDERGASMVEYGLLLALIAIIALVAVQVFGNGVTEKFSSINSAVN